jgi:hypothetical protein
MNKELLKEFQLQAGGSHYPSINPELQEKFAQQIVKYCIDLVENAQLQDMVYTTFQQEFARGVKQRIADQIKQKFNVH